MDKHAFGKLRVLVADVPYMAALTASMLRNLGVRSVTEVNDSKALGTALELKTFDLLIIDDTLGPADTVEVTRTLRANAESANRSVPVLMTFMAADKARIVAARDAGVTEFLLKPLSVSVIGLRLTQTLSNPRPFVAAPAYAGPDRRRKIAKAPGPDRRAKA